MPPIRFASFARLRADVLVRVAFALSFAALLGACAAGGSAGVTRQLEPAAGETVGWVAASVGARGGEFVPYQGNSVNFRPVGGRGNGNFYLFVTGTSKGHVPEIDYVKDDRYFLNTYLVPLRPGRYEVHQASMLTDVGIASESVHSKKGVSLPFTVEPGKVTYLGSFSFETFGGKNLFGQRIRGGGYVVVTNELARDVELLRKKNALPAAEIVDGVPAFDLQSLFIRARQLDGKGIEARLGLYD